MSTTPANRADAPAEQPAPQTSAAALAFALAGAPLAWVAQTVVNFATASLQCAAAVAAAGDRTLLGAVQIAALVLAIGSTTIALAIWRRTGARHGGSTASTIEIGESRTHFLALLGLASGLGFTVALLFAAPGLLLLPACPR